MAWTAIYIGSELQGDQTLVKVVFSDGTQKIQRDYAFAAVTLDALCARARQTVQGLDAAPQAAVELAKTLTPGMELDLTPPVVVPVTPTKADTGRAAFSTLLRTYQQEQRAKALGMPVTETVTVGEVAALWQDAFVRMV